ncbi:MAG TPA: ATP-binding protein [Candidatus Limnocylindrales bacterium]|nr:ATP-binding protein [Candidatus Limnocylindrales bacterium]
MRLSLKTRFTVATSILVFAVVALVSGLYLARLTRQTLREASKNADFVARQVLGACKSAVSEANERGESTPGDPAELRTYVQRAFDNSSTLNTVVESDIGFNASIIEITITDENGIVIASSDSTLRGQKVAARPSISSLANAGFFQQLRELFGPPQTYEDSLPFELNASPFGAVRVGLSSAFMGNEIQPGLISAAYWALGVLLLSTLLAFVVSSVSLAPLERISRQLDRISAGQFDLEPAVERGDELGQVSNKIVGIGKQLRDVREIFSTLRENLDQVMSGLEDGLLLFNVDGVAVLVSPAAGNFLRGRPEELRGHRVSEIFPPGHSIRSALQISGEEIEPVDGKEAVIDGPSGAQRVGVSVQAIREHGTRMGTLVTLRDVESLERIGNQLQVSERLAALGRVTAGVAHEVKNPLNSMRLWLEVLKGNMPVDPEPQQAVKMLDTEIDRLDHAVKTFLNFTRPVELRLEETDLRTVLDEVLDAARPAVTKAGLTLTFDYPAEFPPVLVDRQLIHQALLNLVLNACDFTERGGRIGVTLHRGGEFAVISVADSGKGIPTEDQKKIFQLFFTTRPGGTGIGLANTFRFVQLHNGRIEFDSKVGNGTTFRVELPLARLVEMPTAKVPEFGRPFAREQR